MSTIRTLSLALAPAMLSLTALPAIAQDAAPDTERMTQVIETEVDTGKFMGAVLVAQGEAPVIDRAWGMADLEWGIANTTDTKFRIGSVTKQFTAVSILLLAEQGKIELDAPIASYLEDTPEAWEAITVRNLLRHTSGIPNVTALEVFEEKKYLPISQDELIGLFSALPLEFVPGSEFSYSNSGYVLLSRIVENVSGESLADFYRTNIFDPLGMEATGIDVSAQILPKRAEGYSPAGDDVNVINAPYADMGIPTGAGALYSTTGDLLKWQRGLFGGKVLSEASLAEYLTPAEFEAFAGDRYALGVLIDRTGNDSFYWHGGGIEGFNAWLGYDPARETTVVVLANLNGGAANKIGEQLMTLVQGREVVLPEDRVAIDLPVEKLAEYEGVYALAPDFKITVFLDGEMLMTQATGQDPARIWPEGDDRFFLKVIDAQIGFNRDADGTITGATLFQNNREFPAPKE
jgi:CubicO group peptidase (beta-lactamase class C family)